MVMTERYGIPTSKIIGLMSSWQVPFRNVKQADRFLILTDDAMDPLVWQSAMAAIKERGGEVTLALYPRRSYHCADPSPMAVAAAKEADVVIALTTTALNSGTPGLRAIRAEGGGSGRTPIWLMEESTVEVLTEGGGRATLEDVQQMCDLQRRIGEVYDKSKKIRVTSKSGSDLVADISGMPPGHFAERWGKLPFERDPKTGRLGSGTWPFGEIHVEPVPGTANGTIVWDTTSHYPPGLWREPVALTIKDGRIVSIDGSAEADQVRWYLETYGDENSWFVGGEIAVGTNHRCWAPMGLMRNDKKSFGAMHFGIGHGADRGKVNSKLRLEGITRRVTFVVDDNKVVCEEGKFKV
jgi:leucyl aminopeptidase (aminopeptidase T)